LKALPVKVLQLLAKARRGIPKGAALRAGAPSLSAPLAAFFGYFLGGARK